MSNMCMPHVQLIFEGLKHEGVPMIHFGTGTTAMLQSMRQAGGDVIGVDWRIHLDEAWAAVGHDRAVQGNLDPVTLFAPIHEIERRVEGYSAKSRWASGTYLQSRAWDPSKRRSNMSPRRSTGA